MGSPGSLKPNKVPSLEVASALITEPLATRQIKGSVFVEEAVPPQGFAYITLELE